MSDGQIVFQITGDNTNLKRTLEDTTKQIGREADKWDRTVDDSSGNISESLTGAFSTVVKSAAFVKIAQMLAQLAGESIQLASDLEEVQNVVDVTFGTEGSGKVEKWAKEATKNFGLTELQAKRYASTLGAMMKSSGMAGDEIVSMSTDLAGLAADMSSFYNLDFDVAFQKIRSGISGETEPLRQLGINMNVANLEAFALTKGLEKNFEEMTQGEQTLLRYQYLMSTTADAQGDFARTSDNYANSQRRMQTGFDMLKAKLGETLLPIATQVSNAVNDLLDLLLYEPPETAFDVAAESMTEAAKGATQAQGILGYMDKLYEKYGSAATKTEEWATALEKLKAVFPEVNKFIDAETGALTASNEQLREYIENSKQAAIEDAKKAALASLNEQYVSAGQAYYTAEINRDIANEQAQAARQSLIDYIRSKPGQEDYTGQNATMQQMLFAAESLANEYGESQDTIHEWARIYDEQMAAAAQYETEMGSLEASMQSLETDLNIATAALERLSAAAGAAAGSMGSGGNGYMTSGEYYNWYYGHQGKGFATGLDFVPVEGFYHLHPGERVQTAAEASLARQYGLQQPGMDYGAFGSAMWANAPQIGGNVYLDGRTVGRVISDQQAKTYRNLQRSGWQG